MRACGECTECCTGTLIGEVQGIKFDHDTACSFLKENKCSIYDSRPEDPCKNYSCMWINNESIPDYMRPDLSHVVLTQSIIEGIYYIESKEAARKTMTAGTLANVIMFAYKTNQNIQYFVDGQVHWMGEPRFVKAMERRERSNQIKEIK